MADWLRRVPLPVALQRFAEEMDDAGADLIIAALILNSRLRGPACATCSPARRLRARRARHAPAGQRAGRKSTRRSVQIVIGVTVAFVVGPGGAQPHVSSPTARRSAR